MYTFAFLFPFSLAKNIDIDKNANFARANAEFCFLIRESKGFQSLQAVNVRKARANSLIHNELTTSNAVYR